MALPLGASPNEIVHVVNKLERELEALRKKLEAIEKMVTRPH